MAALAGLVAALRRGEGLAPLDLFRLREIDEFSFAKCSSRSLSSPCRDHRQHREDGTVGVAAIAYLSVHLVVLMRRQRLDQIATYRMGFWSSRS